MKNITRRQFLDKTGKTAAGAALAGTLVSGLMPGSVLGANENLVVAVIGTNSRGNYLSQVLAKLGTNIKYICDVDKHVIEKTRADVEKISGKKPKGEQDFRKALEDNEVDAVVIAAPDHWHTNGDYGAAGRKARLRREALLP